MFAALRNLLLQKTNELGPGAKVLLSQFWVRLIFALRIRDPTAGIGF